MSWASERCKSQSTSHRSAELSNASLNAAEHRLALPRYVELCHRPPVTIKPAPQLLLQSIVRPYVAPPRSLQLSSAPSCSVESRTALHNPAALHHRSKFTIKTWPQLLLQMHESGRGHLRSAVLQHRTPLRPAQLSNAMPCEVGPCFALRNLAIVPGSRLKPGLMSASPSW